MPPAFSDSRQLPDLYGGDAFPVNYPDFIDIKPYVSMERRTPIIFTDELQWPRLEQWQRQRKTLLQRLSRWIEDAGNNRPSRYPSHYSMRDLQADGRDFKAFEGHKRWVKRNKRQIRIGYENLTIYRYPGEKDRVSMEFDQEDPRRIAPTNPITTVELS